MQTSKPDGIIVVVAIREATSPGAILIRVTFDERCGADEHSFSTRSVSLACHRIEEYLRALTEG